MLHALEPCVPTASQVDEELSRPPGVRSGALDTARGAVHLVVV